MTCGVRPANRAGWLRYVLAGCLVQAAGCAGGQGQPGEPSDVSRAEYELASDAFHKRRFRDALRHVDRALEEDEDNGEAAYLGSLVALVFCARDDKAPDCRYPLAETYVRRALELNPELRDARNVLGVVLIHQGRAAEAIAVLEPLANDIVYGSPEKAWGNLGWAYLEAGQTDQAIGALRRAVAAEPLFCVGHYRLGLAYEKKGEHAAARQALTRTVSIDKGGCDRIQAAFQARGRVLTRLGERRLAMQDLQTCHTLERTSLEGEACAKELRALK